ncbi:MAG: tRNA (adenosine(37)-N6)-dimethylallyltransferase MiaA [Cytophagales bacterium]|nr:tRNA (adenosine(37)-N6)-dimethylallyltransferase MiaA [Cytophagales bacterium]MCE2957407.1 tRNA (adenosine(37)-N6)-dimethylallyltransferase MiaA [Flammeovirgaceae bacterium]MCZ8070213.1 tRNA (adenosine(37)-N6)-dimethylallyltransferase MiaA [Cytophagales bacterium]
MRVQEKKLVVIVGPTASGKTALAIDLALRWNTEIISADSRQIYKELEIGTAKPTDQELTLVKHHFINTHSVEEVYNAAQFGMDAEALILNLFQKHDYLLVCGGSGLYVKALLEGFDEMPEVPAEVRNQIVAQYQEKGLGWLQAEVKQKDPNYFETVDIQNPQRLMRALEVFAATGKPFSAWRKKSKKTLPYSVIKVGLDLNRDKLYERIDARMDKMIVNGLFEEAAKFYPQKHLNALQTVGYQEIFGFMDDLYDKEEAIRLLKRNSRHYAKRQLTWFKRDAEVQWFQSSDAARDFCLGNS